MNILRKIFRKIYFVMKTNNKTRALLSNLLYWV